MQKRSSRVWVFRMLAGFVLLFISVAGALLAQLDDTFDYGIIAYSKTSPTDPIARLQSRIESGETTLQSDSRLGYLPAILRELKIPKSSQSLVFSKTSFQFTQIATGRPRALYFNDEVYVGYVQGSRVLEFASVDPKLGAVFYTFEATPDSPPTSRRAAFAIARGVH